MNKKKIIGIALIIAIFIGLAATIVYIFTELKEETDIQIQTSETTDAKKFKSEYEDINGKEAGEGKTYRVLTIDENNPMKYSVASDIVNKINNNESFVVYFGFSECPWCRSILESLLESAKEYNIDNIYYVDVKNIRDVYSLNENNELVRTTEGTDSYYTLLNKLANVLDDYKPLKYELKQKNKKKKVITVEIGEKRIYAPNVVLVKNGTPLLMTTGISDKLTDPYMELTDEMKNYAKNEFGKLFEEINPKTTTTTESNICDGHSNC